MRGVETAFYLVHPMSSGTHFEEQDRRGAANFAAAARGRGSRPTAVMDKARASTRARSG
jgi:hypothetical protein